MMVQVVGQQNYCETHYWEQFAWLPIKTDRGWRWLTNVGFLRTITWDKDEWERAPNGTLVPANIKITQVAVGY